MVITSKKNKSFLLELFLKEPEEARRLVLRELDLHGGSPAKVSRVMGVPLPTLQCILLKVGMQHEARKARERWDRMFRLGGNDEG